MDPLDLMKKYYGRSVMNYDDFLNSVNLEAAGASEFAEMVLKNVKLIPQFAEGGLAEVLQAPRRGRVTHPGGYSGSKWTKLFREMGKAGGSSKDFSSLYYKMKSEAVPINPDREILTWELQKILGRMNEREGGRVGYVKGRLVKSALAILNRNKKNADYMFKASDNVSPGYAAGDLKYNAELLADQLADDAGVVFADLDSISQTKFYGTAYDYLAAEMGKHLLQKRAYLDYAKKAGESADSLAKQFGYGKYAPSEIEKRQIGMLEKFDITGRKPSASGGLAGILEV